MLLFKLSLVLCCGCENLSVTPGKPNIRVDPEVFHFRTLNRGETDVQMITVENTGTAPLIISSIQLVGDRAFSTESWGGEDFSQVTFPDGIRHFDGDNQPYKKLGIAFSPSAEGEFASEVVIVSNVKDQETVRVVVDGLCSVPDVLVEPLLLDFGYVGLDSSALLILTIKNEGEADLIIQPGDMLLASGDPDSPFIFGLSTPMVVGIGQSTSFSVIYAPKERHVKYEAVTYRPLPLEDTLLIHSNDPNENPVEVALKGRVGTNLAPVVSLKIANVTKLNGEPTETPCSIAPTDTITFQARAIDPEGNSIQSSNLEWEAVRKPVGSNRLVWRAADLQATFKPDISGEYTVCVKASDPQGKISSYDPDSACACDEANQKPDECYDCCPCMHFSAYPREDIYLELIWEFVGPDLDLHLLAPGGDFCTPTKDCSIEANPDKPNWDRIACVNMICQKPNCDPVVAGCRLGQECYDGGTGPACWWKRCSGTDCYWDGKNPDWGVAGDKGDDPLLAIDCVDGCRRENINLNNPAPGIYTIMVNCWKWLGDTRAKVRIFFKGDLAPTAEFTSLMTNPCDGCCDTWNVALIDWIDHENHPVLYLGDSHVDLCCN